MTVYVCFEKRNFSVKGKTFFQLFPAQTISEYADDVKCLTWNTFRKRLVLTLNDLDVVCQSAGSRGVLVCSFKNRLVLTLNDLDVVSQSAGSRGVLVCSFKNRLVLTLNDLDVVSQSVGSRGVLVRSVGRPHVDLRELDVSIRAVQVFGVCCTSLYVLEIRGAFISSKWLPCYQSGRTPEVSLDGASSGLPIVGRRCPTTPNQCPHLVLRDNVAINYKPSQVAENIENIEKPCRFFISPH